MPSNKEIKYTTKAKKDLKRYRYNSELLKELYVVLRKLAAGEELEAKYKKHPLYGNYYGCLECHIMNDFLLIWIDEETNIIEVVRIGSHSELFG